MELNGKSYECVYLTDSEREVINVLRTNETDLSYFIYSREQYIESLKQSLHQVIFTLEAQEFHSKRAREQAKKVYENAPWTLEEIKKATHGSE